MNKSILRPAVSILLFLTLLGTFPFTLNGQNQTSGAASPPAGTPAPAAPPPSPTPQQPQPQTLAPAPGTPPAAVPRTQIPAAQASRRASAQGTGLISLNFDDADVFQVIQTVFGDVLHVNYIVDPRVKGRVTFRSVAPVPKENVLPLMEVILRLNGIAIVEEAGLHRLVPIADIAKEPAPVQYGRDPDKIVVAGKSHLQVVPILNIQSSEIVKLVTPFLSANAVLVDVPRANQVIIVDTDANVRRLLELIQIFDGDEFKKRAAEVYVYPVQNSKAKDVSGLLQQIFLGAAARPSGDSQPSSATGSQRTAGAQPSPAPSQQRTTTSATGTTTLVSDITRIFSDDITNAVIIVATPEDYEIIRETIQRIDIVPRQVVIEGVVAQITLDDNLSLGVAWSASGQVKVGGTEFDLAGALSGASLGSTRSTTTTSTSIKPVQLLTGNGFQFVGVDQDGIARALITALATDGKGKVLAAPHILVSDNREARIQVGSQVPIPTVETIATASVAAQRVIQYKDIGIIMKVKPQVNESGLVTMEITQEVSTFRTIEVGAANTTEIVIDKSEASSHLVVQDGQTIIIGGLIREDTNLSSSGFPFLNKIPFLGYLFGQRSRRAQRQEIIILLTPHVIKSTQAAKDVTEDYVDRFTKRGRVTREELVQPPVRTVVPPAKPVPDPPVPAPPNSTSKQGTVQSPNTSTTEEPVKPPVRSAPWAPGR